MTLITKITISASLSCNWLTIHHKNGRTGTTLKGALNLMILRLLRVRMESCSWMRRSTVSYCSSSNRLESQLPMQSSRMMTYTKLMYRTSSDQDRLRFRSSAKINTRSNSLPFISSQKLWYVIRHSDTTRLKHPGQHAKSPISWSQRALETWFLLMDVWPYVQIEILN